MRKVIVLSSCFPEDMDSEARNTLMVSRLVYLLVLYLACFLSSKSFFLFLLQAAADKCVSVEFLLLDEKASHLSYTQEKTNRFLRCLSDLDNCSFQTCIPGSFQITGCFSFTFSGVVFLCSLEIFTDQFNHLNLLSVIMRQHKDSSHISGDRILIHLMNFRWKITSWP